MIFWDWIALIEIPLIHEQKFHPCPNSSVVMAGTKFQLNRIIIFHVTENNDHVQLKFVPYFFLLLWACTKQNKHWKFQTEGRQGIWPACELNASYHIQYHQDLRSECNLSMEFALCGTPVCPCLNPYCMHPYNVSDRPDDDLGPLFYWQINFNPSMGK